MKIGTQILAPVAALTAAAALIAFVTFNHFFEHQLDDALRGAIDAKVAVIRQAEATIADNCLAHAALYSSVPAVREAYTIAHQGDLTVEEDPHTARARELLREQLQPFADGHSQLLDQDYHLHFHLPTGRSLLRVWRPSQDKCDDISSFRQTVLDINRGEHTLIRGIEVGRGGFVVRGLTPVTSADGKHLGSVEMLSKFLPLIEKAKWNEHEELFVYMNDNLLNVATKLADESVYPRLGNYVQVTATAADLGQQLISPELLDQASDELVQQDVDGYRVAAFPVKDYCGNQIGRIALAYNLSDTNAKLASMRWMFGTGTVVVMLLLTLTAGFVTRNISRGIAGALGRCYRSPNRWPLGISPKPWRSNEATRLAT